MTAVQQHADGFAHFNDVVQKKLRSWIVDKGMSMLASLPEYRKAGVLTEKYVPMAKMLAILKFDEGDESEARNLLHRIIATMTSNYGADASETIDAVVNLADFLAEYPSRWREAKTQYEEALNRLESKYGKANRQYIFVLNTTI
jgi:hypothetical protein